MIDEYKICFIICSNNEMYLEECFYYINQLEVPDGYTLDAITIFEANSMAGAYNEAMSASDAKYKIYLHQDVFILYKGFLNAVLDIFHSDSSVGMIGMVGAPKMPVGGVMWQGHREGQLYGVNDLNGDYQTYQYALTDGLHEVDAIDGLMMITSTDIPWREDKFNGWDFYDVSQSFEFRKKGYKVVVPEQLCPWCKHDGGVLNLVNYDKYRKICMAEYSEYFYPERFRIGKFHPFHDKGLRAVIIARNQFEGVKSTIESLKLCSGMDESQIIIVDNGSEDGLKHWLLQQDKMDYIICGEVIEGYGAILGKVTEKFIVGENLLILTAGLMVLPGCMDALCNALEEKQCGAVCAKTVLSASAEGKRFGDAVQYAVAHADENGKREVLGLPYEAVMIRNEMLRQTDGFEERLILPGCTLTDFAFQGVKKGYYYYEIQNAFVYRLMDSESIYFKLFERDADRLVLKEKWKMNYFNEYPNYKLLSCVKKEHEEEFNVLEIGCDCGVNLLPLKNQYPNVSLFGVEINSAAAEIASHIAKVQVANIEEKNLDFGEVKFDYILFGDVLEHLREPEETIRYCKEMLKEDGRIIACIPNLMHYSVLRELLDGNFSYADKGLLDKAHVHFFTYNEIVKMFETEGLEIEQMMYTGGKDKTSEEDKKFVTQLLRLSGKAEEFMFYAFQYVVSVKRK